MDILIFPHHTMILIFLDQTVMCEDRMRTLPLGLLCQHSAVICTIQGSRFLFCFYFMYSAKKWFSTVCCRIRTILRPREAICCFSVEPGSFAFMLQPVCLCGPAEICREHEFGGRGPEQAVPSRENTLPALRPS